MMFGGQGMNNDCLGPDISLRKLKSLTSSNDSELQFLSDVSRKRKGIDSLPDGNTYNESHPGNLSVSFGHLPLTDSNLPLPRHTPSLGPSNSRTRGFPFDNELISARPMGAQSHFSYHLGCSVASTLTSSYVKGATFLESANDYNAFPYQQKELLNAINVTAPQNSMSTDSSSIDGTANQTESSKIQPYVGMDLNQNVNCTETYLAAQASGTGMNLGYQNCNIPSKLYPCSMTSPYLQSAEPYNMRMVNEYSDSYGGSLVKDKKERRLFKANNCGQYTDITDNKSTKKGTSTSAQLHSVNWEEDHGLHENPKSYKTHSNYPDHLNSTDEGKNQKDMNYSPIPSDCENTCSKDEISKNVAQVIMVSETRVLKDTDDLKHEDENHSLETRNSVEFSDGLSSRDSDGQNKSVVGKISSVSTEKLWDGSLQLNTSTTVSAVAFFKSGEKAKDIRWSDLVEVKGKVRLQAFEKFIQELPRSRTRALMVISLCWKAGSSISGLTGMKEVAKGYKENKRVGFAQICSGIDLYVCPRSEIIITILAKFGFFKGMAAVEEDQNSLIGCVVWRRNCQSNSASKASDRKTTSLVEQPLLYSEEIPEMKSPLPKVQDDLNKQVPLITREPDGVLCQCLPETRSINADLASHMKTENKLGKSRENSSNDCNAKTTSVLHNTPSLPYNSPIAPVQISPPQELEFKSKECSQSPLLHTAEGRLTVFGSEPARSVLLQSSQMLPESHRGNITCSKNLNDPSSCCPDTLMLPTLPMHFGPYTVRPQTLQGPHLSYQENPTASVSKAENYIMHSKESDTPAMSSELSQITLPGPPPLPPEVLQRIIQSRAAAAKGTSECVVKAEIPIGHVSEPKKSSMLIESSPPVPAGPPPSLPQALNVSPNPVDVDDLPEFDFSSACEVQASPASKYPWSGHPIPDVPLFNKQLPSDLRKNPIPLGSTMMQPIEVIQRQPFPSFLGDSMKTYHGSPRQTNFEKPVADNKVVVRTSLSYDQPCLDADKGSVGPSSSSSFLRKHRWDDDDDDMPEWCPPDLEHVDRGRTVTAINLSSPVRNWNSEFGRQRPFIPPPSPTSLCSPGSQGPPHGYIHRMQGPLPLNHPTAPVQPRPPGYDPSIQRPPFVQYATNLSSHQNRTSNKRPSDVGSRFRRP